MVWDASKPDMDLLTGTDFSDADALFQANFEALELALIEHCNFPGSLDYIDEMGLPKARRYNLAGRAALSPVANMWILRTDRKALDLYHALTWHSYQAAIIGEFTLAAFDPTSPPLGWLACDGSAISQTTYAALYAVIGVDWGDPGGGNFNLPDAEGCVLIGMDDGDADYDAIAKSGGALAHQLVEAELPDHDHTYGTPSGVHTHFIDLHPSAGSNVNSWLGGTSEGLADVHNSEIAGAHTHTVDDSGESRDVAHNNKQPYLTLGYLIYTGV